jgi:hypothetical protein
MFLKFYPYRVWCSIFYSKLINCTLFKIVVQHVRFVKGRGTCSSGERNVKILIDFRKSPRFSLTSSLSQLREKSSRPVFTMCGEPWYIYFYIYMTYYDIYFQCIADSVGSDMNRLFQMFCNRNPSFQGSVSVAGHSLGKSS